MTERSKDRPPIQTSPEGAGTPDQVALLIRYALSQLSINNAHHEFEHLCRHITRRRIASNIIPSTGPVSAGGDGGADFETISVIEPPSAQGYWRLVESDKTLFACSLEQNLKKKVKQDLVSAAAREHEQVAKLYFFTNQAVATGTRNQLKKLAVSQYAIELEIVDSPAIAEFLADSEMFWIAERYLSLPISLRPPESSSAPKWYSRIVRGLEADTSLSADSFYQIKSAIRHATFEPECHSDIPKLIQSLQRFKGHPHSAIARRAFYEEFVAALRGLNAAEGYEEEVLDYLSSIAELSETDELEQASNLLGYAAGATARNILKIPETALAAIHTKLLARVIAVTPERPSFVRCAFLFIRGFVEFKSSYIDISTNDGALESLREAVRNAVQTWTVLLEEVDEVRIFPIERLSSTIDFLFPIVDEAWFSAFTAKLDALIAKRNGSERMAETLLGRGSALLNRKQHFRALNIFHEALDKAQDARSQRTAIIISLQLAELYLHLRLYHASKYYALCAAFAAISLKDDELKELAAVGLAVACEADYANGSSMLFFLTYQMFVGFALEYRLAGTESYRQKKWGTVDYYATLLTRASMLLGPEVHTECLEIIKKVGLYDEYSSHEEQLNQLFGRFEGDLTKLAENYADQEGAAPFSDLEEERQTAWKQEGIEWHVSWPGTYQAERLGSAFCAVLQVALASLHKSELTLAANNVRVRITVDEGKSALRQKPSNEILEFTLNLSYQNDLSLSEATFSIFEILKIASAMPDDQFDQRFMERFRDEIPKRCGTYVSPSGAFREFYSQDSYAHFQSVGRGKRNLPVTAIETHSDVPAEDGTPHPDLDAKEAEVQIARRYERITRLYPFTIARLSSTPAFHAVLIKLREQGWKDWHILQAIASIRVNDLGHRAVDQDSALLHYVQNGETAVDPPTLLALFSEQALRRGLQMSQLQTLANLGLRVKQMTPNLVGIDRLLRRFRYWELDLPHENPFKTSAGDQNPKSE
jgi:hypothetical protein